MCPAHIRLPRPATQVPGPPVACVLFRRRAPPIPPRRYLRPLSSPAKLPPPPLPRVPSPTCSSHPNPPGPPATPPTRRAPATGSARDRPRSGNREPVGRSRPSKSVADFFPFREPQASEALVWNSARPNSAPTRSVQTESTHSADQFAQQASPAPQGERPVKAPERAIYAELVEKEPWQLSLDAGTPPEFFCARSSRIVTSVQPIRTQSVQTSVSLL